VIVAFRSDDVIRDLVEVSRELPDVDQVVVVDNGDGCSAAIAERMGAGTIRRPDNPGFGAGQNAGVASTSAPYVLLLNPDAVPVAGGISAGGQYLAEHDDVAAVQGAIVNDESGAAERSQGIELGPLHLWGRALGLRRLAKWRAVRRFAARSRLRDHVERGVATPTEVETLAATALLVRRSAFDEVGGFDERYFLYGEDLDLCRRLRGAGWRLVALPSQFARHQSGASSAGWWERELVWWNGTMQFAARWWRPWARVVAVGAAVTRWFGLALSRPMGAREAWQSVVRGASHEPMR
jgi:GT2 family glycosyltransferase